MYVHLMQHETELLLVPEFVAGRAYVSWFTERKLSPPPLSKVAVYVAHPKLGPIFGVQLFATEGPYIVVEHASTNPRAPLRLRHEATQVAIQAILVYSALAGKWPMVHPNQRGMALLLSKGGFVPSPSVPMTAEPVAVMKTAPGRAERPGATERRGTDRPKPRPAPRVPRAGATDKGKAGRHPRNR